MRLFRFAHFARERSGRLNHRDAKSGGTGFARERSGRPECATAAYNPDNSYHLELENLMLKMTGVFEMPHWRDDLQAFMTNHELLG